MINNGFSTYLNVGFFDLKLWDFWQQGGGIEKGDFQQWGGDFHPKTFGHTAGRIIELILSTVLPKQEQEEQFCSMNFGMTSWSFLVEKTMTICISILYVHSGLKMEKYFNKNGCTILKKISSLTPFKKLQKIAFFCGY